MAQDQDGTTDVRGAIHSFVEAALPILESTLAGRPLPTSEDEKWVRSGPSRFRREQFVAPDARWLIFYDRDALEQLPEYERAAALVKDDPVFGPQTDVLVGTALGGSRVEVSSVVMAPLFRIAEDNGRLSLSDVAFDAAWQRVENFFYDDTIERLTIVPIHGLNCENEVKLLADLAIRQLTDEEIGWAIYVGVERGIFPSDDVAFPAEFGLVRSQRLPKLVGDSIATDVSVAIEFDRDDTDIVERALGAIRLGGSGRIAAQGWLTVQRSFLGHSFSFRPRQSALHGAAMQLSKDGGARVVELFAAMQSSGVEDRPYLGLAVRRLNYAGDRLRAEDRVIDSMIAAEALFLKDSERDELTFKFSVRVARFAESAGVSPRQLHRFATAAYRVRSKLVHGTRPTAFHRIDGTNASEDEMANDIEDLVRRTLAKYLIIASTTPGKQWLLDPDETLFDESQES